jgi:hypothetical protein
MSFHWLAYALLQTSNQTVMSGTPYREVAIKPRSLVSDRRRSTPFVLVWLPRIIGHSLVNNSSTTNTLSACGIANIAFNDAMVLPYNANPGRMGFSERTALSVLRLVPDDHDAQ